MTEHDGTAAVPLRVWRRSPQRPASAPGEQQVLYCGGPDRTVDEIFLEMRERKRQWDEERARQKAKAEEAQKDKKQRDDEDDSAAVERFRNDRYAVGLLRQDTTAWGDGPTHTGTLG
ncbi:hypothetical protein AB0M35_25555 [Micromonospora sp. NPDC051196]|uniref:hypothetical protein n=1 Tax=Micromonospora sp. NPDC051196 TaxID=3155281 RepID=UPI00341B59D1